MKLKKLLATGLALCMAGSMLAGCGSGSGTTTAAATTAAPAGTTAEATTAADGTTAAGTTAAASAGETDFRPRMSAELSSGEQAAAPIT